MHLKSIALEESTRQNNTVVVSLNNSEKSASNQQRTLRGRSETGTFYNISC